MLRAAQATVSFIVLLGRRSLPQNSRPSAAKAHPTPANARHQPPSLAIPSPVEEPARCPPLWPFRVGVAPSRIDSKPKRRLAHAGPRCDTECAKQGPLNMATELNSPAVESLTDFTKLIEERLAASEGPLWHRGCADFDHHHLTPGLYRHPTKTNIKALLALEKDILKYFELRSIPFVERILEDSWKRLFFMQHHAIPTRLLDWTENPFVALYFGQ